MLELLKNSKKYSNDFLNQLTHALLLCSTEDSFRHLLRQHPSYIQEYFQPLLLEGNFQFESSENFMKCLVNLSGVKELAEVLHGLAFRNIEVFLKTFSNERTRPFLWMFLSNLCHCESVLLQLTEYFSAFSSLADLNAFLSISTADGTEDITDDLDFLKLCLNLSTDATFQNWLSKNSFQHLSALFATRKDNDIALHDKLSILR